MQTFSRKTRNGYWKAFKSELIEEGWMWTSRLPSYHAGLLFAETFALCFRFPRAVAEMPSSLADTLGYRPAHNMA